MKRSDKRKLVSFGAVALFAIHLPPFDASNAVYAEAGEPGIAQFIKIRWPRAVTLSPDGTLYFLHDPDGIRQLYKVAPGQSQADAAKLTTFEDGIGGFSLSDDGRWIAITASVGGSEQADLFLMNAATGEMETLFGDPDIVYGSVLWRRDSKAFAYRANDESRADFHVYVFDLAKRSHKKALAAKGYHYPADFNKAGTKLMVAKYNSASFSQLFEVDLASGKPREITPPGEQWSFDPVGYTRDEGTFLTNTNYRRDLQRVHSIDTTTGRITPLFSDLAGCMTV